MRHDVRRHVEPLSEAVFLILVSLSEEPRHGYAILKDVEALSNHHIRMSTGTLYGALRRLLDDRWIERIREADAPRGRLAYRLSAAGRGVLNAEISRMKVLTRLASSRLARGET
jgi:DNA-binding PadR family transcriptional regulator